MKPTRMLIAISAMILIFSGFVRTSDADSLPIPEQPVVSEYIFKTPKPIADMAMQIVQDPPVEVEEPEKAPDADISLIALVTMAEAEGECELGKRLVIDTILNRVDSAYFPDTVYNVVYQKGQFSSMWNGRVDRCEVREDICRLVEEELAYRTNDEVIFFNAGHYSRYGVPLFQVEHHYFSKYE